MIGIEDADGAALAVKPLDSISVEAQLLRLEQMARTGVEPNLLGLRMMAVQVDGGAIIVIQVPPSFNPPHRVTYRNTNRYYARHSSGTYELSLEELRLLFGKQRTVEDRARAFVRERFNRIQDNDGAVPLPLEKGGVVLHLIPLGDFGAGRRHDLTALQAIGKNVSPMGASGYSNQINLDGLVVYRGGDVCNGYTQIFRDGSIEATSLSVIALREGRRLMPSLTVTELIFGAVSSYATRLKELDATAPMLLQISFFGMKGVNIGVDTFNTFENPTAYQRDDLHLPHSIIPDFGGADAYSAVVAEQLHFLWNVFGLERCPYFDPQGRWTGR